MPTTAAPSAALTRAAFAALLLIAFMLGANQVAAITWAQPPTLDATLRDRIDAFVERERLASGIPGIALAIVQLGSPAHLRGFGDDGRGRE